MTRCSPDIDRALIGLAERLDRLCLTSTEDGRRFVLATESAGNIVEIVREWLRTRSTDAAATPSRPDSIYSQFHLDNWTDDDFAKHAAATRKTLAWLLKLEASLQARHDAQRAPDDDELIGLNARLADALVEIRQLRTALAAKSEPKARCPHCGEIGDHDGYCGVC